MTNRRIYSFGFIVICSILLTSIYLQFYDGMEPCPLCTLQRLAFALLGLIFFFAMILNPRKMGRVITSCLLGLSSLTGLLLAGRQVWLQFFVSSTSDECGVSLQYMLKVLPVNEVMQRVFTGSAECSQRGMEFLSLNTAQWSMICFAVFFLLSLYLLFTPFKK